MVDGQKYEQTKAPKMAPGERQYFKALVELVENRNKWYNKAMLAAIKLESLYEEFVLAGIAIIILVILWFVYGPSLFAGVA